jgi:hypothetical protein
MQLRRSGFQVSRYLAALKHSALGAAAKRNMAKMLPARDAVALILG